MHRIHLSFIVIILTTFAAQAQEFAARPVAAGVVSTARNEYNFQRSDNGNVQVFARADADFSHGKILLQQHNSAEWTAPQPIVFSDPRYKDSDPWLSADGRTLYFISDRPTYAGEKKEAHDYDVWRSRLAGPAWIAPEPLGSINSPASEFGPEVHGDYLYFSSTRSGEYEVYRSRLENGGAAPPERLPEPINSAAADSDFTLSPNGRVTVWCSNRPGGAGGCDLYTAYRTANGWSPARNLGPLVNTPKSEFTPSFSPNGARLYFASSRTVAGQGEDAADIYEIAVNEVPALQAAITTTTLDLLKTAFGGAKLLARIKAMAFTLEQQPGKPTAARADYFYDFSRDAIIRREGSGTDMRTTYVRGKRGEVIENGAATALEDEEQAALQRGLLLNFLELLTRDDVVLNGPFDITGYHDLQWYQLAAGGDKSPLLGLDPRTGRIVIVRIDDTAYVLETDYTPTADGLIWPHRYLVQGAAKALEGRISEVRINPPLPPQTPSWLTR